MFKYEVIIYWSEEDKAFIAEVPELPGCASDGQSYQEALANVETVIKEWIDTAKELGRTIFNQGRLLLKHQNTALLLLKTKVVLPAEAVLSVNSLRSLHNVFFFIDPKDTAGRKITKIEDSLNNIDIMLFKSKFLDQDPRTEVQPGRDHCCYSYYIVLIRQDVNISILFYPFSASKLLQPTLVKGFLVLSVSTKTFIAY